MKVLITGALLLAAATASADPYESHGQDGNPYWVTQCGQAEWCFEEAYQWCDKGPYTPVDKAAYLINTVTFQFRFVCKKPHKDKQVAKTQP